MLCKNRMDSGQSIILPVVSNFFSRMPHDSSSVAAMPFSSENLRPKARRLLSSCFLSPTHNERIPQSWVKLTRKMS